MYFFIGIKGTGMAALAIMLKELGHEVNGSDIDRPLFTEDLLRKHQIPILSFNKDNIKDNYQVIIGNAFFSDHPEVKVALENPTIKTWYYHEYLGELLKNYASVAISGTHGKTTTTALLAAVLNPYYELGYLIGDGTGHLKPETTDLIIEACEFKRHFLAYHPDIAVVTNIGYDHVDYFKTEEDYFKAFQEFVDQAQESLVIYGDSKITRKLKLSKPHIYYGSNPNNDLQAVNIVMSSNEMSFDVIYQKQSFGSFTLPFVGAHMLQNSLAVIAVSILKGLTYLEIKAGFKNYRGVKRRFIVETIKDSIFIDDYAHHPVELKVTLETARIRFPNHKIVAVYKPHRVSRIFHFVADIKAALSLADEIVLLPFNSIDDYESHLDIDIDFLANQVTNAVVIEENQEGVAYLASLAPACFVFMSDKDIYHLADQVKKII